MYTMDRALQEVAVGYAGAPGFAAAGNRAIAVPGVGAGAGVFGGNNILLIAIIIIILCVCTGNTGGIACHGRRRKGRRGRVGSGFLLLIVLAFLFAGNNGGRNVNTNVINVNAQDDGVDDDILDL